MERYKLRVSTLVADAKREGLNAGREASDAHGTAKRAEVEILKQKTIAEGLRLEIAQANERTEELRLQNQKLVGYVAPRKVTEEQCAQLPAALKKEGITSLTIDVSRSDVEAISFASSITRCLAEAGVNKSRVRLNPRFILFPGLTVAMGEDDVGGLIARAFTETRVQWRTGTTGGIRDPAMPNSKSVLVVGPRIVASEIAQDTIKNATE